MESGRTATEQLIRHAVCAGGLRAGATKYPEARKGLLRAADFHSAKVAAFTDQIAADADLGQAFAGVPKREA